MAKNGEPSSRASAILGLHMKQAADYHYQILRARDARFHICVKMTTPAARLWSRLSSPPPSATHWLSNPSTAWKTRRIPCAASAGSAIAPPGGKPASEVELLVRTPTLRPWRAYAALHLWQILHDNPTKPNPK